MARFRKTGGVKLGKIGGHVTPKIRGTHRDWVLQQIDAGGDVTPQGLADGTAERDLKADNRTVRNFVHSIAKRFKKPCTVLSRTASPSPGGSVQILSHIFQATAASVGFSSARNSGRMFMYRFVDRWVPAMCRRGAAARLRQD
jgi:hypothetical protein